MTVPPSRTRCPAPGSAVSTRPAGTVSEYAGSPISTSRPAASSLLSAGPLGHAEDGRRGGVARPAEPPRAGAAAGDEQQREQQQQRTAPRPSRPAGAGDPRDLRGWRHRTALDRGRAVDDLGSLGRGGDLRGHQAGELVDVEGVGLGVAGPIVGDRDRRGVGGDRPRQREVGGQVVVLADAVAQGLGDPVHLVEQHAGVGRPLVEVARSGARDERVDVRRQSGRQLATAAARPRGRACRRPGSATRPRAACCR